MTHLLSNANIVCNEAIAKSTVILQDRLETMILREEKGMTYFRTKKGLFNILQHFIYASHAVIMQSIKDYFEAAFYTLSGKFEILESTTFKLHIFNRLKLSFCL
jgi:hypothetical protein